jgi:hypothetical protein
VTTGSFPDGVRAPVSYGRRVKATVAYLLGRHHIPNRRVAEAMADLFGLEISTGLTDVPARLYGLRGRLRFGDGDDPRPVGRLPSTRTPSLCTAPSTHHTYDLLDTSHLAMHRRHECPADLR